MNKYCITFAGAPGSGKTPIAHYLSGNLSLPIISNDAIRSEVIEDLGHFDQAEYVRRRDIRAKAVIDKGQPFVYDSSVDRSWDEKAVMLTSKEFKTFVVSLDLSRDKLYDLYTQKSYDQTAHIDSWLADHEEFLKKYSGVVNLHIDDSNFKDRLELSLKTVQDWLNNT
ncbi:hypothetical protein HYX70_02145 [Candidatus Saccharibacteria bacterium]|nr:hypothetical protein [Candidatus Saccharibacteria bacterium]